MNVVALFRPALSKINSVMQPFVMVRKRCSSHHDESFVGYGQNKVHHIYELAVAGYTFVVHPTAAFILHVHPDNTRAVRGKSQGLDGPGWLCSHVGGVVPHCQAEAF